MCNNSLEDNSLLIKSLNISKRIFSKIANSELGQKSYGDSYHFQGQQASDIIKTKLSADLPVLISRLGNVELSAVINYLGITSNKSFLKKSIGYIKDQAAPFWWDKRTLQAMALNAGFFPVDAENLQHFSQRMLEDMKEIDVLGSWLDGERFVERELAQAIKVKLGDLEPYYHHNPWSEVLQNKKVLVIHPFSESIKNQYQKRTYLFKDHRILPEFELKTIQAVQSIGNNKTEFSNWFEALDSMSGKVAKMDFDFAIIGCGAYGLPLGAFVKKLGKKAIHLGGATQILFGIKGKRWEENEFFAGLFNEYWVKPLPTEVPLNFTQIEGGCFW